MKQYLDLLQLIKNTGIDKPDRTGTGTKAIFAHQMRFNLQQGFPLITTKKVHISSVVHELLWFLKGDTNTKYLNDNGVKIWNEWADKNGDLGRVYGAQWRSWQSNDGKTIDQIATVVKQIKKNPQSRRILVSAWNVGELDKMALPPCHLLFQFFVAGNKLSCQLYQRSCDVFLGVPFNIASYALLTHMIAQQCNLAVGEFIWTGGDCHIYNNHSQQVTTQLSRKPKLLPTLNIKNKPKDIFSYKANDFEFLNYNPHEHIKGKVSV